VSGHHPPKPKDRVMRGTGIRVRDGTVSGYLAGGSPRNGLPPGVPYTWRGDGPQPSPAELVAVIREQLDPVWIRLVGYADGRPVPGWPAGSYLQMYDAEASRGRGRWFWTADPERALILPNPAAAHALWTRVPRCRPVRHDGQPNRPLTQFTVIIERVPDPELEVAPLCRGGGSR